MRKGFKLAPLSRISQICNAFLTTAASLNQTPGSHPIISSSQVLQYVLSLQTKSFHKGFIPLMLCICISRFNSLICLVNTTHCMLHDMRYYRTLLECTICVMVGVLQYASSKLHAYLCFKDLLFYENLTNAKL